MYQIVFYEDDRGFSDIKEYIKNNKIIVLSQFMKTTQETPKREIEKAKRRLNLYKERGDYYD